MPGTSARPAIGGAPWASATATSVTASAARITRLRGELHRNALGNEALLERLGHQPLDSFSSALAVAERQVVHVHADKRVGARLVETAPELLRILDGVFPMRQRIGD